MNVRKTAAWRWNTKHVWALVANRWVHLSQNQESSSRFIENSRKDVMKRSLYQPDWISLILSWYFIVMISRDIHKTEEVSFYIILEFLGDTKNNQGDPTAICSPGPNHGQMWFENLVYWALKFQWIEFTQTWLSLIPQNRISLLKLSQPLPCFLKYNFLL